MPLDWRNLLPPAPEPTAMMPSPATELLAPLPVIETPREGPTPPRLDCDEPGFWQKPATPSEVARAEAYREKCERELGAAEQGRW
jgi:hypothetical protein